MVKMKTAAIMQYLSPIKSICRDFGLQAETMLSMPYLLVLIWA